MWKLYNAQLSSGQRVDIHIDGEYIVAVTDHENGLTLASQDIDAHGALVFPGGIDMHVHFRSPGLEYKEDWVTGSDVALANGYTYVCDMPNTIPPTITYAEVLRKKASIQTTSRIPFNCYIGATQNNLEEIQSAQHEVCGVKVYYGTSTGALTMNTMSVLEKLFSLELPVPIVFHAEDDTVIATHAAQYAEYVRPDVHSRIRGADAAIQAVADVLRLARKYPRTRVHITHVSTAQEVDLIRSAQSDGCAVTADVTPHHLWFTEEDYCATDFTLKVNPPLRTSVDRRALWTGLREGVIACIASDHAPHTREEKHHSSYALVPAGLPSLEFGLLSVLERVDELCTYQDVEEYISTRPAQLLGLQDRGMIAAGMRADMVCIDSHASTTVQIESILSRARWSPWEGVTFRHRIIRTILGGTVVYSS